MIAKDLINYMIPPLKPTDTISKAKEWIEELRVTELPVASDGMFLGFLTEEMIYDHGSVKGKVSDFQLVAIKCVVSEDRHYYDILKTAYASGIRLVAVTATEGHYIGSISIENVVEAFANLSSVSAPGAILVLSMEYRDYSLMEISRIIESNEAKILSSHIINDPEEPGRIKLTIKVNQEEISHIRSVLSAKGYVISESYNDKLVNERDNDRFDMLMKYLKI